MNDGIDATHRFGRRAGQVAAHRFGTVACYAHRAGIALRARALTPVPLCGERLDKMAADEAGAPVMKMCMAFFHRAATAP